MSKLSKKNETKKAILAAIKKILEVKGKFVTPQRIAKIIGCSNRNLVDNYFYFIRENCKGALYHRKRGGESVEVVEERGLLEKRKNINPELSDKAWGIGLVDHSTYRR